MVIFHKFSCFFFLSGHLEEWSTFSLSFPYIDLILERGKTATLLLLYSWVYLTSLHLFIVMVCNPADCPLKMSVIGSWTLARLNSIWWPMGMTANLAKRTSLLSATIMSSTYLVIFWASLLCCKTKVRAGKGKKWTVTKLNSQCIYYMYILFYYYYHFLKRAWRK